MLKEIGKRVRLEDRSVRPRLDRLRIARSFRLHRSGVRDACDVEIPDAPRGCFGITRAPLVGCDDEHPSVGHSLVRFDARRGHDRKLGDGAREEAVDRDVCSRDRFCCEPRLILRPERGGPSVIRVDGRKISRRRQTGEVRVDRCAVGGFGGAAGDFGESIVVDSVRRRGPDPPVSDDAQRDGHVVDQRRLVNLGFREAREARAFRMCDHFGVAFGESERGARELESVAHDCTPIWTSRKRAGAAPCETCALCPGWPLPQFVMP